MSFVTSTRTRRANHPPVHHRDHHRDDHRDDLSHRRDHHPAYRRRLRGSCCAAAVAAVALSVPSGPLPVTRAAAGSETSTTVPRPAPSSVAPRAVASGPVQALASAGQATQTRRVCVSVANVRSGPGLSYRVVTTVRRGTTVRGTASGGWLRIRTGRWIAMSVTCRGTGAAPAPQAATSSFRAWVRAIDPAGNAQWTIDHGRTHTRGNIRGLTVFRGSGPTRSTVYIQPGMSWAKTKLVMAHEAIHVRQVRYGGFSHSVRVFGSVAGMERAADCGATLILRQVVRGGCPGSMATRVRNLLAGRPA